jgi:sialic acid synthase SpsE
MKSKELSYDEFRELNKYCLHKKILFFATAHDEESLDFLDKLGVPLYKIGSGEICNHQFLRSVARKHKPVLISTGMYTQRDIESALRIFHEEKNRDIILLHCITAYPAHPQELNLKVIPALRKKFKIAMGYSDHTLGNEMAYAAIALGACVIEKHITIRKNVPYAQDWIVSCDRQGLKDLVSNIRKIEQAMGSGKKNPSAREKENKKWARKSIVAKVDIKGGTKIKENMLCFKRPGTGISPVLADKIIGRRCLAAVEKDDLIKVDNLEK